MTALKIADLQRDAYTEGREEGISLGREEGISLGMERGREEGISIGLERGAYEKALETAKTMISIGLPEEQIQLCTDLPLEVIRDLLKKEV